MHGSVRLTQWLLAHDLLDEHHVLTMPVVVGGGGHRLHADDAPATAMRLVASRTTGSGVVVATYRPAGAATFGTVGA
ncbi:hypothetical protein GCM10025868_06360 [Angustibacter aerolatus]|uniref:Bacterial bifunctional deaminase-reductase C-terminal domain-containing protein n=1 Tax=Angustibacter aerolatus TaxID=1162965 RepID=A0ABQ6JF27_9ACTN|nr:hypothetical protein GCM10025868_06360 [Angustibacter aerolatus]